MNWKKWAKDSFVFGLITGAILLFVFYFIISQTRLIIAGHLNDPYIFLDPRSQLIAVTLNLICFRFLLLKYEREKTAKGILFITVISTFAYFLVHHKWHL
jgi:hypothetical protein